MLNCPNCNQPLVPDANTPGKVLCYNCRKRFDAEKVKAYWARDIAGQPAPSPASAVAQPASNVAAPVPYGAQDPFSVPSAPAPVPNVNSQVAPAQKLSKGMAIASLVLGILCLSLSMIPFVNVVGIVLGIVAIILGVLGIKKTNAGVAAGKGMGIAGIVLSAVGMLLSIAVTVSAVIFIDAVVQEVNTNTNIIEMMDDDGYLADETDSDSERTDLEAAVTYDDKAAWTSMQFNLNGRDYTLGVTKLAELAESGWSLDLNAAGYENGYMVEPNQMISVISLSNPADDRASVYVNVVNETTESKNIMDCELSKISFVSYDTTVSKLSVGGVGIGDPIDKMIEIMGQPQDIYDDDDYVSCDYYTSTYDKTFEFTAYENNVIDEISLSIL